MAAQAEIPQDASRSTRSGANAYGAILEVAIALLGESGPSGMRINEVCLRAGVRPPAIYYHFGSKDGLVAAAVQAVAEAWLRELETNLPEGGSFEARLQAAVDGWQAMIMSPMRPVRLLLAVQMESADLSDEIRKTLNQVQARACQVITDGIEKSFGPLPGLATTGDTVVGLIYAAAIRFDLDRDPSALRARLLEVARLVTLLLDRRTHS